MKVLFLLIALFAPLGLSLESILVQEPAIFPDTHEAFLESTLKAVNFNGSEFIFGGQRAQLGDFPYQAYLSYRSSDGSNYICGASILTTTHVVTAAHCAIDLISPSRIMVGTVNVQQQGPTTQVRRITRKVINGGYNPQVNKYNDIAVLEFSPAIDLNQDVKTVKIAKDDAVLLASGKAIASGFGTYTFRGNQSVSSPNLLYTNVDLFKKNDCIQRWRNNRMGLQLNDGQICAGAAGHGAGPGDSGGPLQVTYKGELYEVGIASFVAADLNKMQYQQDKYPNVYVRATYYCDFIYRSTGNAYECVDVKDPNCP